MRLGGTLRTAKQDIGALKVRVIAPFMSIYLACTNKSRCYSISDLKVSGEYVWQFHRTARPRWRVVVWTAEEMLLSHSQTNNITIARFQTGTNHPAKKWRLILLSQLSRYSKSWLRLIIQTDSLDVVLRIFEKHKGAVGKFLHFIVGTWRSKLNGSHHGTKAPVATISRTVVREPSAECVLCSITRREPHPKRERPFNTSACLDTFKNNRMNCH